MKKKINNKFTQTLDELGVIAKEYKTTLMGIGVFTCIALFWTKQIDGEQFTSGVALLTTVGFFVAKDAK